MLDQPAVAAKYQSLRYRIVLSAQVGDKHIVCRKTNCVGDPIVVDEFADRLRRRFSTIVYVHSHYFETAPAVLTFHHRKLRSLLSAGWAPRRPEIHHQHLTAII